MESLRKALFDVWMEAYLSIILKDVLGPIGNSSLSLSGVYRVFAMCGSRTKRLCTVMHP